MSYLEDTLAKRAIFFTGKGGVGKSLLALSTALLAHEKGKKVALIRWSPFESAFSELKDFQLPFETLDLETLACFKEYALKILRFDKIYDTIFDNHVLKTFIRAAPGLSETVVAGKIWDLFEHRTYDLLVVDLPASGHAYSFFKSPIGVEKVFRMGFVHNEARKVRSMFESADTRLDFVAIPEELSIQETSSFHAKLKDLVALPFGFLHINQCLPEFSMQFSDPNLEKHPTVLAHMQSMRMQEECLKQIGDLPLKPIQIERFATEDRSTLIENIKGTLKVA